MSHWDRITSREGKKGNFYISMIIRMHSHCSECCLDNRVFTIRDRREIINDMTHAIA